MIRPNDTILCIGDSITHAHRRPEELHDCYYLGGGYVKLAAARLNARQPELNLRWINRGECGDNVARLKARWQRDCLDLKPSLVSILVGINDSGESCPHAGDVQTFEHLYRNLLQTTRDALPTVRFCLLEPFGLVVPTPPLPAQAPTPTRLANLKRIQPVIPRLANEFDAIPIPLQTVFDEACKRAPAAHWALDGVHPSAAGHELIATQWLKHLVGG